jgi:membrane-bound lytic murein transglycosylase D
MKKLSLYFFLLTIIFVRGESVKAQNYPATPPINLPKNGKGVGFKMKFVDIVQQYTKYYQGRAKDTMERRIAKFGSHENMIKRIFREENVPNSLSFLWQVREINGSYKMLGVPKPLWLFDSKTSKKYGLRINKYLDERASFEKATRATARYLKSLHEKYDENWETAIGAYYIGEVIIDKAIKKTKTTDYWTIYSNLPRETRNFVPNVLASILIINNKEFYGFENVKPVDSIAYDNFRVPKLTKLSLIANATETTVENLKVLNPELRTDVSPNEPYIIRIPVGKVPKILEFFKISERFLKRKHLKNN